MAAAVLPRTAVVIPTYDEVENIGGLLDALEEVFSRLPGEARFLVVDDQSTDGTPAAVLGRRRLDPRVHLLSGRRAGLGAAYIRGLGYALEHFEPDVVVQMDGDLSHSPQDIPRLLEAVSAGADLAIGSRYSGGCRIPPDWSWRRRCLSRGGNLLARHWLGLRPVMDCTAGFRAWRASTLGKVCSGSLATRGYVFQVAMLQRAVALGARVVEVPVEFRDRLHGSSKLGWADLVEFARWTLARHPSLRSHP